jgi:hypothetical protein
MRDKLICMAVPCYCSTKHVFKETALTDQKTEKQQYILKDASLEFWLLQEGII